MNILINAYACAPNWGSEQGMAWHWITELAKMHNLYVITEGEWKKEIEEAVALLDVKDNIHFYYNPVSDKIRSMCWNQGDWRFYWYYRKWQKKTLTIARQICSEHRIDIIHQLNMIGFREPGYLWNIYDTHYIWGPVGGMEIVPLSYLSGMPLSKKTKYIVKNMLNHLQIRYSTRVCKAIHRADIVIAATQGTYNSFVKLHHIKPVYMNEAGCTILEQHTAHNFNKDQLDILWVGRFLDTKKLDIAIRTIAKVKDLPVFLHIVGNGSDTENAMYQQMADKMGISNNIKWYGKLANKKVQEMMNQMDLFLFTSVLEGTPHVVLEAITNCLPILCIDTCGQGQLVNEAIGWKVPLTNPQQNSTDFAAILRRIIINRDEIKQKSDNCKQRQRKLSWENKLVTMNKIYQQLQDTCSYPEQIMK
jgi:glycosyltransferase involved in cell wall biosynthesis